MKPIKDKFFFLKTKNIHFNFNCKPNKNKFTFSMKKSTLYSKTMRLLLLLSNHSILNFRHLSVSFMKRTCLLRLKLRLSPRIIKSSSFNQKKSTMSILNLRRNILAKCKWLQINFTKRKAKLNNLKPNNMILKTSTNHNCPQLLNNWKL